MRNDNSSRFGKYVRMLVEKKSRKIQGAAITNYLLEKSRITTLSLGERNYHIFYHFIKGADEKLLKSYGLQKNMKSYEYLKGSDCFDVENIDDEKMYREVNESFEKMKFSKVN